MIEETMERSVRFFGAAGQRSIYESAVAFVGVGGLGSMAVQLAALHRVGRMTLIEPGELKESNRNRYVAARHSDAVPGTKKVDIARRMVESIAPGLAVDTLDESVVSESGIAAIKDADVVVGCVDLEGVRLVLLQLCAATRTPYLDLATEIIPGPETLLYGGRVVSSFFGDGCLACREALDSAEASRDLAGLAERANRDAIYGVDSSVLADSGPSVASLNGVIASLGMMELFCHLSGLRPPRPFLNYHGPCGKVALRDERRAGTCYFCDGLFAGGHDHDLEGVVAGLQDSVVAKSERPT